MKEKTRWHLMVIAVGLFGFFIFEGKYFIQEQTEARTLVSENILALSQHEDWDGVPRYHYVRRWTKTEDCFIAWPSNTTMTHNGKTYNLIVPVSANVSYRICEQTLVENTVPEECSEDEQCQYGGPLFEPYWEVLSDDE